MKKMTDNGTTVSSDPPLHSLQSSRLTYFNRFFAAIYFSAIVALLYRHLLCLLASSSISSFVVSFAFLISDILLAFMWATTQACRMRPVYRYEFIDDLRKSLRDGDADRFPAMDVFLCTADPYKEPPMSVVNTALSVMAYDYPSEKISLYVSDDGGSVFTLFAFMEAAKFASHWLPFCRKEKVMERNPEAYFSSDRHWSSATEQIKGTKTFGCKEEEAFSSLFRACPMHMSLVRYLTGITTIGYPLNYAKVQDVHCQNLKFKISAANIIILQGIMYESMKVKVENVLEVGKVSDEYIAGEHEREGLGKWTDGFTRQNHPTVVQVLLESGKDRDISGQFLPNLVYVSRQKSTYSQHHYKAGALNALLRVSAVMTNSPIILNLDCDMYSNDPETALRALCYFFDLSIRSWLSYVQFPQRYHSINKDDIYGSENKRLYILNPTGMNGFFAPHYLGTGCFFARRSFFGGPFSLELPELEDLGPNNVVSEPIHSPEIIAMASRVAACDFEKNTKWGSKVGFRYGSLVEDFYTGFRLKCEGWRSVFCNPDRAAFYGDVPIGYIDALSQHKRWALGLLEVTFSKHNPLIFGIRNLGLIVGLMYSHNAFWPSWSIPVATYAFLPQLALIRGFSVFPKVTEAWFFLYLFLFIGAYGQDLLEFTVFGSSFRQWWNDQRMWMVRGLSSLLFGIIEFTLMSLRISTHGFNVTSKVLDGERTKRYEQQLFDFGAASPMFVPLTVAANVNLVAFSLACVKALKGDSLDGLFLQILIAGFGVVNCLPVYSAMAFRVDSGRIPTKITVISAFLAWLLCKCCCF